MIVNILLFRMSLLMQTNYNRLWIDKKSVKNLKKIKKKLSINIKILINIAVIISNHKIKMKSEILIRILNKNHMINVIHMICMTSGNFLNEIVIDQKIIFSSKNTNIVEKIIFILNMIIWIIQSKTANFYLIWNKYL